MPPDLDVTVGIDTAAAEEGLRRLSADFHREIRSMGRASAEARIGANVTQLDAEIVKVKRKLTDLAKEEADPAVQLDTKRFEAEVRKAKLELKELGTQKAEIAVDARKLKDANRELAIYDRRQAAIAKQNEKVAARERKTNSERERAMRSLGVLQARALRDDDRRSAALIKQQAEVSKLRAHYNKLTNDIAYLEQKTGRPGGIFHTEKERLALAKLRDEATQVEHRVRSLGGTIEDITPDLEDDENALRRWTESLAAVRLHLGFFSASVRQAGIGLIALGPIITGLLGATTSLIGVMGTGLAGAASVGSAGVAGLAASFIGVRAAIGPTINDIGLAIKAQEAYHKAVLKYGKGDSHVAEYQEKLANTLKGISPRAREAIMQVSVLKERWRELTKPVRHTIFDSFAEGVTTVKALLPSFAHETVATTNVLGEAWDRWMQKLRGQGAKSGISEVLRNFREGLPSVLRGFEALGELLGRITVSASKLLPELSGGFEEWARNLNDSVGSGNRLDESIERLVRHMQDLGHLSQAAGRLIISLFNTAADSGDGLVQTLTRVLNRWADWMGTAHGQNSMRRFFAESKDETEAIFSVLGSVFKLLFQLGRATAPFSNALLHALTILGDIIEAVQNVGALGPVIERVGKLMAALWIASKVKAWTSSVLEAARALRILGASAVAAEAETTAGGAATVAGATGAAEGAAGAGSAAGASTAAGAGAAAAGASKLARVARGAGAAGLVLAGFELAESFMDAFQKRGEEKSPDVIKALAAQLTTKDIGGVPIGEGSLLSMIGLGGDSTDDARRNLKAQFEEIAKGKTRISEATERSLKAQAQELHWTKEQRKQVEAIFKLTSAGRRLGIRVDGGMDPDALQKLIRGYKLLRSGALASLSDIGRVTRENSRIIAAELPKGSIEARTKLAQNFRAAAAAIKHGMDEGTINVKKGTEQMRQLLRNAKLVEGQDPLGIARGFRESWKKAGGINRQQRDRMIDDLRKMPPASRAQAYQSMIQYGRGLVRGGKIPKEDLNKFRSQALTELEGIGGGFNSLAETAYGALHQIHVNLSQMLRNIGGKPPKFNLQKGLNMLPELKPIGQQQGGFTVPGSGSGDKVPAALPYGSFVMNREAASAYGLNRGGAVQTILEPRERVFLPHEVARIGPQNLEAMNNAVPRQKGGPIGKKAGGSLGEPQIIGPAGSLLEIGQGAVHQAFVAAKSFYDKQNARLAPAAGSGGGGGYTGPAYGPAGTSMYKGILMATWVREALEYAASHGVNAQPTSGYRSHAENVAHGRTYFSEHEKTQYPGGAVDFGGFVDPAAAAVRDAVVRATASFKYPLLHPIGFRDDGHASGTGHQAGGFALSTGGPTPPPGGELVGASYYGGPTDHVSGTVGSSGVSLPGKMAFAELAMGKALGGLPYHTKLKIGYNGRSVVAEKLDIGLGGDDVNGKNRAIDLWYETANAINMPGTAVVKVSPAAGAATGGSGAATTKQHRLPKTVKVKHPVYEARQGKGGGTEAHLTKKTVTSEVPLDIPEFGPIPNDEGAVRRELAHLSHKMLPEYRSALRQNKEHKQVAEHLRRSLTKIENRIRALRDKLRELRYAKARKRLGKKIARQLGRITGQEGMIEAAERDYEQKNEFAAQVVSREPEQPGELTEDWIERVFEPYINAQESPAYGAVLNSENRWRNVVLTAEEVAKGIEHNWEAMIGYPEKGRKPHLGNPDLHFPPRGSGGATGLADWIYGLHDQIERIRDFAHSHTPKWWSEHPRARARRDRELNEIDTYFKPQLDYSLFRRKSLINSLGEGRDSFNWFNGTGSFEQHLQDVQGFHWPDQHEKLPGLPTVPVPGVFGGAIWETQETIQELGLKVRQAKEQLEGAEGTAATEPDRAAEIAAFEEAIRGLAAGRPFVSINQGQPFMGAFARGGVALVGERGPELAHLPHGTRIHDAEETARLLEPQVVVDLSRLNYLPGGGASGAPIGGKVINVDQKNYFPTPPPDPHTWARGQVFELEAIA